jgi:hypothetical protein
VVDGCTYGSWSTEVIKVTRVDAMMLDTGLVVCAIFVDVAFYCLTFYIRISNQTLRAAT